MQDAEIKSLKEQLAKYDKVEVPPTKEMWDKNKLWISYDFYVQKRRINKIDLSNLIKYPQDVLFEALNLKYTAFKFNDNQVREYGTIRLLESEDNKEWICVFIRPYDLMVKHRDDNPLPKKWLDVYSAPLPSYANPCLLYTSPSPRDS